MDYLGDDWMDAVIAEAGSVRVDEPSEGATLVIQTVVTDGPRGDVAFHLSIDGTNLAVRRGHAVQPTVSFTQHFAVAVDVASGRRSAQEAFMAGDIRVGGDATALIEHRSSLGTFDAVMARVAADTVFPDHPAQSSDPAHEVGA